MTRSEVENPHNIIQQYIPISYVFPKEKVSRWYTPCCKEGDKDSEEEVDFAKASA
jgi:hypothetical protein